VTAPSQRSKIKSTARVINTSLPIDYRINYNFMEIFDTFPLLSDVMQYRGDPYFVRVTSIKESVFLSLNCCVYEEERRLLSRSALTLLTLVIVTQARAFPRRDE